MRIFSVIILMAIVSCTDHGAKSSNSIQDKTSNSRSEDTVKINASLGVIVTSELYSYGEKIEILDTTLKPMKVILIDDEYQMLTLNCLSTQGRYYLVLLSDGKCGYISKENPKITFQTWSQHVLNVFSVDFDKNTNPIRVSPDDSLSVIDYKEDEFYHPVKVQQEWLQVKWGTEGSWEYGWIKWHNEETLLIELFYFA